MQENAKMQRASLPYRIAPLLRAGDAGQLLRPAYQRERLRSPQVRVPAERVRITRHENYEAQYPVRSRARATVKLRTGAAHTAECPLE
jgi:2-methylcitrate dehydratase PrpD